MKLTLVTIFISCILKSSKEADTVRLGDRFLITEEDDDIAQQHKVEKFIVHPDYKSYYHYNDIAMIKTVKNIVFSRFVVPSCIDDIDSEQIGYFSDWTVAGYGEVILFYFSAPKRDCSQ